MFAYIQAIKEMIEDDELAIMKAITTAKDISMFCKKECPMGECYAEDKDPLKCWMIQRKFGLIKIKE